MSMETIYDEVAKEVIGQSSCMQRVRERLARLAGYDVSVLICGESGTGKELAARTIHQLSARRSGPFLGVNCAAIHESLQESELFGHEAGAFTGAGRTTLGVLRAASGGTILLDEVGDMSRSLQGKLLRVLEERTVIPVGGVRPIPLDVRVLAATNRDLAGEMTAGRFRMDLYHRLNVVSIALPPLRERREDIPELAEHLLRQVCAALGIEPKRLAPDAIQALVEFDWPGNVRQVGNAIQRGCVLSDGPVIRREDLGEDLNDIADDADFAGVKPLSEVVSDHVAEALAAAGGVRSRAAELLGVSRKTLYRMMDRYQLL